MLTLHAASDWRAPPHVSQPVVLPPVGLPNGSQLRFTVHANLDGPSSDRGWKYTNILAWCGQACVGLSRLCWIPMAVWETRYPTLLHYAAGFGFYMFSVDLQSPNLWSDLGKTVRIQADSAHQRLRLRRTIHDRILGDYGQTMLSSFESHVDRPLLDCVTVDPEFPTHLGVAITQTDPPSQAGIQAALLLASARWVASLGMMLHIDPYFDRNVGGIIQNLSRYGWLFWPEHRHIAPDNALLTLDLCQDQGALDRRDAALLPAWSGLSALKHRNARVMANMRHNRPAQRAQSPITVARLDFFSWIQSRDANAA